MARRVHITFVGAGLWDQQRPRHPDWWPEAGPDVYPFPDVPFPRVPVVGERLRLPDQDRCWIVRTVEFDFDRGLHYEPVVRIVCEASSEHPGERQQP